MFTILHTPWIWITYIDLLFSGNHPSSFKKDNMKASVLLIGLFMIFQGCKKTDRSVPGCINDQIRKFKSYSPCNDAKVDEYLFQNELVFVFEEGTCVRDGSADVYNDSCELLGSLGGFTGNLKINDVNFSENAVFQKTVWRK